MNSSNLTDSRNLSQVAGYLMRATHIVTYSVNTVSAIGVLFNLFTLSMMLKSQFKHKYYDFLRCRVFIHMCICMPGVFLQNLPCMGCTTDFVFLNVQWYAITLPARILFLAGVICDNLLILNRLVNIQDLNDHILNKLSKKVNIVLVVNLPPKGANKALWKILSFGFHFEQY